MKCPRCGAEMRDGYLHAGKGAYFSRDEQRLTVFARKSAGDRRLVGF